MNHFLRSGIHFAADVIGDTLNPIDRTLGILAADTTRELGSRFDGPEWKIRLRLVEVLSGDESANLIEVDYFPEDCYPLKAGDRAVVFIYTHKVRPFVIATAPFLPDSVELKEAVAAMAHARLKAENRTQDTPFEWMCDTKISCPTLDALWCPATNPASHPDDERAAYQPQFYECPSPQKPKTKT